MMITRKLLMVVLLGAVALIWSSVLSAGDCASSELMVGGISNSVFVDTDADGIRDAGEQGIPGVTVRLLNCSMQEIGSIESGANGAFAFSNLVPGNYRLSFDASGVSGNYIFSIADQGSDDNADSDVNSQGIGPCVFVGNGITLTSYTAGLVSAGEVQSYVWHDVDYDGLQDNDEGGLADIPVELYSQSGTLVASRLTSGSGYVVFDDLYPGEYFLKVLPASNFSATLPLAGYLDRDSDYTAINGAGTTESFVVNFGQSLYNVDIGLLQCIPIGQFVWYDTDADSKRDFEENGVNGFDVVLYKYIDTGFVAYDTTTTGLKPGTGSTDGYFKFCVEPGEYFLAFPTNGANLVPVIKDIYGQIPLTSSAEQTDDSDINLQGVTDTFIVQFGDDVCNIGAGFYPPASLGDFIWLDEDRDGYQDSAEKGIADVVVRLFKTATGELVDSTVTDSLGKYLFEFLQPMGYYIQVDDIPGLTSTIPNFAFDKQDSDLDNSFGPNTSFSVDLAPGQNERDLDAGFASAVLPVVWDDVAVVRDREHSNVVSWATLRQINASHFVVERSFEGGQFEAIGRIEAGGNSTSRLAYDLKDEESIRSGRYDYRILQYDYDEKMDVSKTVSIVAHGKEGSIAISPNPSKGLFNIAYDLAVATDVNIEVYDNTGRRLESISVGSQIESGAHMYPLDLRAYSAGIYTLRLSLDRHVITRSVVVMH